MYATEGLVPDDEGLFDRIGLRTRNHVRERSRTHVPLYLGLVLHEYLVHLLKVFVILGYEKTELRV